MRNERHFQNWQTSVFSDCGSNVRFFSTCVSRDFGPVQNIEVGPFGLLGRVSGTAGFLAVFSRLNRSCPRSAHHERRRYDGVRAPCFRAIASNIDATSPPSAKAGLSLLTALCRHCGAVLCCVPLRMTCQPHVVPLDASRRGVALFSHSAFVRVSDRSISLDSHQPWMLSHRTRISATRRTESTPRHFSLRFIPVCFGVLLS